MPTETRARPAARPVASTEGVQEEEGTGGVSESGLGSGPGSGSGKELGGGSRWLEFNDSEVTEFSESRLDAECFGGTTISHDFHKDTKVITTTNQPHARNSLHPLFPTQQPSPLHLTQPPHYQSPTPPHSAPLLLSKSLITTTLPYSTPSSV